LTATPLFAVEDETNLNKNHFQSSAVLSIIRSLKESSSNLSICHSFSAAPILCTFYWTKYQLVIVFIWSHDQNSRILNK